MPQERLLPRQQRFVWWLVVHNLSVTQAAMRAGYSRKPRSAAVVGCRLIHNHQRVREGIRRLACEIHGVDYFDAAEALRALHLWRESAAVMPKQGAVMLTEIDG